MLSWSRHLTLRNKGDALNDPPTHIDIRLFKDKNNIFHAITKHISEYCFNERIKSRFDSICITFLYPRHSIEKPNAFKTRNNFKTFTINTPVIHNYISKILYYYMICASALHGQQYFLGKMESHIPFTKMKYLYIISPRKALLSEAVHFQGGR